MKTTNVNLKVVLEEKSDYVISAHPPSTMSMWSKFHGKSVVVVGIFLSGKSGGPTDQHTDIVIHVASIKKTRV